jgi:hypothetical protein
MRKALLAGIFALVFASTVPALAAEGANPQVESGLMRFRAALRLTPDQQKHWPRVEAAIRSLARDGERQPTETSSVRAGFFRRVGGQVADFAGNAAAMRRLVAAAQPLVRSLDEGQKREAMTLARAMGLGNLAARFE